MNDILIASLVSFLTGLSGYFIGFQKRKQELYSASLDNIQKQIGVYEIIIDNLRNEIEVLVSRVEEQNKTINHLEARVEELMNKN